MSAPFTDDFVRGYSEGQIRERDLANADFDVARACLALAAIGLACEAGMRELEAARTRAIAVTKRGAYVSLWIEGGRFHATICAPALDEEKIGDAVVRALAKHIGIKTTDVKKTLGRGVQSA